MGMWQIAAGSTKLSTHWCSIQWDVVEDRVYTLLLKPGDEGRPLVQTG